MKKSQILVLLALAGSSTAFAAPRESVTFTAVPSFARPGDAGNTTMTATFAGADGGGTYNARYLTINGQLTRIATGTYFSEASILVTPPSGAPFIIQPYNTTTSAVAGGPVVTVGATPAGAYTIPVSAINTAGTWSFQFFERWDDTAAAADSTWDTVTITMDDGTPPAAAPIGPIGHTFTDVSISGLTGAPGFDQTFSAPAGTNVVGILLRAQGTGTATPPTTNTTTSPTNAVRVRVTPPGQAALAAGIVFATYGESTGTGDLIISLPAPVDSGAGTWRVEGYESAAAFTTHLHSLAIELLPLQQPAATDLGAVVAGTPLTGTATVSATGQTKWFKFTLNDQIAAAFNRGLEIDTEGSTTTDGVGALNTSIGLFTAATGARVATDFPDGTQSLGTLTFGADNRAAPGDGLPYNGRDGATLATGDYYVAVTAGDTGVAYQPGLFGVTNTSTQLGDVTLNVRLFDPGVVVPSATNLGAVANGAPLVGNATVTATGETKWFKFTLNDEIAAAFNRGLEIDTEGSTTTDGGGVLNTSIGLYNGTTRALVASDLADGTDSLGTLTFGSDNHPAPGNGLAYNGRDGATVPAGEYYVAVTAGDTGVAYAANFGVTNTSTQVGDVRLNVRLYEPGVVPPTATDLGVVGSTLVTHTFNVTAPGEINWLKFSTIADCDAVTNYLDIDTEGTLLVGTGTGPNDTEIGLYRAGGALVVSDDDSGSGNLSQLTFGATGNPRPAVGNGLAYTGTDGTNGTAITAGTYYLAVGVYNTNFAASFGVTHTDSALTTGSAGPIVVNFNSNLPGGGPVCGLADVGSTGGAPGADAHLDNNDFVVYIDYFFTHNVIADMGTTGGVPGADSVWDNNDFVVYIDYFFTAPASCR